MTCNSDYLEAGKEEIELSKVACLLDELDGKTWDRKHWEGYHPAVYNNLGKIHSSLMVGELCDRLQEVDVTKYSLELQMWWRDHQAADKTRLKHELDRLKTNTSKRLALAKLTDYERKLLGLEAPREH